MCLLVGASQQRESIMVTIREAAVAGTFYPAEAGELAEMVDQFMAGAKSSGGHPKRLSRRTPAMSTPARLPPPPTPIWQARGWRLSASFSSALRIACACAA